MKCNIHDTLYNIVPELHKNLKQNAKCQFAHCCLMTFFQPVSSAAQGAKSLVSNVQVSCTCTIKSKAIESISSLYFILK